MAEFLSGRNLAELFHARVARTPGRTALMRKRQGVWLHVTWNEVERAVYTCAQELLQRGVRRGDRVAILSQTRPEWYYVDQALASIGAVSVPVYPTVIAEDVFYILRDSGACAIFVENSLQREKVSGLRARLPQLKHVFGLELSHGSDALEGWLARREQKQDSLPGWRQLAQQIQADDLATIVYTSGTSGIPKGVPLTHAQFLAQGQAAIEHFGAGPNDTTLLYLPVAHIFGRIELMQTAMLGWINAYAEGLGSIIENLGEVRPTYFLSVPRVYERVYAAAAARWPAVGGAGREAFKLAVKNGYRYRELQRAGAKIPFWLELSYKASDAVLFRHVRARFGSRLRCAVSGGAPLSTEVAEFFAAAGVPLFEGYGLSESTGPVTANNPRAYRLGSVGRPLPGCEVRLAEDSEILLRGPQVFKGYYGESQEIRKMNTESFDENGFFRTGDLGHIDNDGFLYITGRKKDLIVTSGGKNIAPQRIENLFKSEPLFSQIVVLGDARPFIAALITLNPAQVRLLGDRVNVDELVRQRVSALNQRLSPFEAIKRYRVLPRELSVEAGELTPSLKVRRGFCTEKFALLIDELYK